MEQHDNNPSQEDALDRWLRLSTEQKNMPMDWSKLDPREIGVTIGAPLTEEQFRAFQARNGRGGKPPTIIKANNDTHKTS
jgi:hypothetical protein